MGLTGVITGAEIALRPVRTALLSVDTDRVGGLDEALEALSAPGGPHRVAWLDLLGPGLARGVVTRAEHLESASGARSQGRATVAARATVPARWPAGMLRASTIRAFNELRFRRSPRRRRGGVESLGTHMFPLDVLDAWPRLYGPHGFVQYQLVVPGGQERVLAHVLEQLRRDARSVLPRGAEGLRRGQRRAAVVPDGRLDAGARSAARRPRVGGGAALLRRAGRAGVRAGVPDKGRAVESRHGAGDVSAARGMAAIRDRLDPERVWRSDLALRTGLVGP